MQVKCRYLFQSLMNLHMMSPNLFWASVSKNGKLFLFELSHGRASYCTISYRLIEMVLCQYRLLHGNVYFDCIQNHPDIDLKSNFNFCNHAHKASYFLHHLKNLPNKSLIWSVWSYWGSSGSPCGCRNSRHYLLVFHNSWGHRPAHFVQAHRSNPFLRKFRSHGGRQGCEPTRVP